MIHAGIDISKTQLDICLSDTSLPPRTWGVHRLKYEEPDWYLQLAQLIPNGALVVVEPTGWHYLKPVITALEPVNCLVWQVPTTTTGSIRSVHISSSKSDKMDARALALAATWIAAGQHVHGAYPHNQALEEAISDLRAIMNRRVRDKKTETRLLNQLDALGHSIWPSLVIKKDAWLKAIQAGAITPFELRDLANRDDLAQIEGYHHGNTRNALFRLVESIPPHVDATATVAATIRNLGDQLATVQQQIEATERELESAIIAPYFRELTRRWLTVPHATPLAITSLIIATRGRPATFDRDQFKAAIGAHPRTAQSAGSTNHNGKKTGYRPAMVTTWFWTMRLIEDRAEDNAVRDYNRRLVAANHPHAFRASIGKLARILHAVACDPEGYRYPESTPE